MASGMLLTDPMRQVLLCLAAVAAFAVFGLVQYAIAPSAPAATVQAR